MPRKANKSETDKLEDKKFPLPEYPEKEDLFRQDKIESFDALEDERHKLKNELDEGLDVPGADLDDEDEFIGEEDEENNYYSLGGENHDDPEEDNGE
jgi:hypothetical protein